MTHQDNAGQPVTFYTQDLVQIFTALGALRPVVTHAQGGWPQEVRDAINKAYSLLNFQVDGSCTFKPHGTFRVVPQSAPTPTTDQNGGN